MVCFCPSAPSNSQAYDRKAYVGGVANTGSCDEHNSPMSWEIRSSWAEIVCPFLPQRPYHISSSRILQLKHKWFQYAAIPDTVHTFSCVSCTHFKWQQRRNRNKQDMYLMKCMSHNCGSVAFCIPPPAVFVYCHPLLCYVQFRLHAPWGKELSDFICLYNGTHTYGTIEIINNNNIWQSTLLPIITYCVHSGKTQKAPLTEVE